jgi:hypothetical protein
MDWTGERILWQNPREHLSEFKTCTNLYIEAMQYAVNKRAIDAACGTGFGSFLLSTVASEVMAVDIQDMSEAGEKLKDASPGDLRFTKLNLETQKADFGGDLCVSIETSEHLENPEFFLSGLRTQALFFSLPCYGDKNNHFHKIEYNEEKAANLIRQFFPNLTYRMERKRMMG